MEVGGDALRKIECQREAANSKLKCREDFLLHYGFAVSSMSHLFPPNVKHGGHLFFASAELSSGLCGGGKGWPPENGRPTGNVVFEINVSARFNFKL